MQGDVWKILYLYHQIRPQPGMRRTVTKPNGEQKQMDVAAKVQEGKKVVNISVYGQGYDTGELIREAEREAHLNRQRHVEIGDVFVWKMPGFDQDPVQVRDMLDKFKKRKTLILDLRGDGALHVLDTECDAPRRSWISQRSAVPSVRGRARVGSTGGRSAPSLAAWFALWTAATIPVTLVSQGLSIAQGWQALPAWLGGAAQQAHGETRRCRLCWRLRELSCVRRQWLHTLYAGHCWQPRRARPGFDFAYQFDAERFDSTRRQGYA